MQRLHLRDLERLGGGRGRARGRAALDAEEEGEGDDGEEELRRLLLAGDLGHVLELSVRGRGEGLYGSFAWGTRGRGQA